MSITLFQWIVYPDMVKVSTLQMFVLPLSVPTYIQELLCGKWQQVMLKQPQLNFTNTSQNRIGLENKL